MLEFEKIYCFLISLPFLEYKSNQALKSFQSNWIKQINNIKNGVQWTYSLLVHASREFSTNAFLSIFSSTISNN